MDLNYRFDLEHENSRKDQLSKLYNRSRKEVQEEALLQVDLSKIDQQTRSQLKNERSKVLERSTVMGSKKKANSGSLSQTNLTSKKKKRKTPTAPAPAKPAPPPIQVSQPSFHQSEIKDQAHLRSARFYSNLKAKQEIKSIYQNLIQEFEIPTKLVPMQHVEENFMRLRSEVAYLAAAEHYVRAKVNEKKSPNPRPSKKKKKH